MSQKVRLRRLRYNKTVRDLFEDTHLRPQDLIYPIFVCEGKNIKNEIKSMPGQYQVSVDRLPSLCNKLIELNIKSVILFKCVFRDFSIKSLPEVADEINC